MPAGRSLAHLAKPSAPPPRAARSASRDAATVPASPGSIWRSVAMLVQRTPTARSAAERADYFRRPGRERPGAAPLWAEATASPAHEGAAGTGAARAGVEAIVGRGGQPLDDGTRDFFARRLGHDFSGVRIHTDARAAASARAVDAVAYTVGRDVVFSEGAFAPESAAGRRLLAHELVHVAQQSGSPSHLAAEREGVSSALHVSAPGDAAEREADQITDAILGTEGRGSPAPAAVRNDGATQLSRQVYGPPAHTGAGNAFGSFLLQFGALESAAVSEGYSFTQRVTAFRKLYYDSASAARTYAGAVVGGGVWNILIPGAAATALPRSWTTPPLDGAAAYLRSHQVLPIAGTSVDIGHLLAGADAAAHPTSVSLAGGMIRLRSNREATTFIGDLGSVVTEYIHGSTASFRDTAMVRSSLLDSYYDGAHAMASVEDMAGNADAYALSLDPSKSLTQNLRDYYAAAKGRGVHKRYTSFAAAIGLGTLRGSAFSGDTRAWRDAMREQVFNAALAYAAGKGWRGDVVNVFNNPGPGVFTPTFWEMYDNISGWVVDIFVNRMVRDVSRE